MCQVKMIKDKSEVIFLSRCVKLVIFIIICLSVGETKWHGVKHRFREIGVRLYSI